MGHIINILREESVGKEIVNEARLEIEECIHFHLNDLRIVMTKENFLAISDIFRAAREKYDSMGQPEFSPHMVSLGGKGIGKLLSHDRIAIEHQIDNTFHIHYKNLRIHLNSGDFLGIMNIIADAYNNIPTSFIKEFKISECTHHGIVDEYVDMISRYERGGYPRESPDNLRLLRSIIIKSWSSVGDLTKRVLGLPKEFRGRIPEDIDRRYLFAIYESIKKYGYGVGPFEGRYVWAHDRLGKIQITNSHTLASLISLGYDSIKTYYMSPPSDHL